MESKLPKEGPAWADQTLVWQGLLHKDGSDLNFLGRDACMFSLPESGETSRQPLEYKEEVRSPGLKGMPLARLLYT